ncbi:MAG: siderophore-interacting protein [Pseudomonadota bacterium]
MSIIGNIMAKLQTPSAKSARLLTVKEAHRLTPNMVRVTFAGEALRGIPAGREGGNCKILIPSVGQSREAFAAQLLDGPKPVTRTYTVRHIRSDALELDVDFVAHGDEGPASAWAARAKPGSFCGFRGPSTAKVEKFAADWYLVAADMSAIPVAAATLEAMPREATGTAIFEITSEADKQAIDAPAGVDVHWLVHDDPHRPSTAQVDFVRQMTWRPGRVQTCIAGESSVIRAFRTLLHNEKGLPKADTYISGYWKIGLVEDQHQAMKRAEAA